MTMILYLNGIEVAGNNNLRHLPKDMGATTRNHLGKSQYNDPCFGAMLDDFRIDNEALSCGEAKYISQN